MNDDQKAGMIIAIVLIIIGIIIFFALTPLGRSMWNKNMYAVQKTDDVTDYKTLKNVEDSCRAMISSYTSDKMIYDQYKNSTSKEKQSWSEQAKMRANQTAATYNEYMLRNSYVWMDNIPDDIKKELPYVE